MKLLSFLGLLAFAAVALGQSTVAAGRTVTNESYTQAVALAKNGDNSGAILLLKKSIQESPNFLPAHDMYIKLVEDSIINATGTREEAEKTLKEAEDHLAKQYGQWVKDHPDSAGVQYGFGKIYYDHEDPRARPYLLKAVEIDPKLATVDEMLSIDAERWGDMGGAREFLRKAAAAAPSHPEYAFSYAGSFVDVDFKKFAEYSLDAVNRYPHTDQAAGGLVWLAMNSPDDADKIKYLTEGMSEVPNSSFWHHRCAALMFDVYLRTSSDKAVALAKQMLAIVPVKDTSGPGSWDWAGAWKADLTLAENVAQAEELIDQKDYAGAKHVLEQTKLPRRSAFESNFELLEARADSGGGDNQAAYDLLLHSYAKAPNDALRDGMMSCASNLGKTESQVDADVWATRYQAAKAAPDFDLNMYLKPGKRALQEYRGKVVLLTFWFPGCGPCRGEFPHFENILKNFAGRPVAYLAVNVLADQDGYVKSFMKGSQFSFTPLKIDEATRKAYDIKYCPTNFLIDQTGRIVYQDFTAALPEDERSVNLMIQSLLEHGQAH